MKNIEFGLCFVALQMKDNHSTQFFERFVDISYSYSEECNQNNAIKRMNTTFAIKCKTHL